MRSSTSKPASLRIVWMRWTSSRACPAWTSSGRQRACRAPACSRQPRPRRSPAFAFVLIVTSSGVEHLARRPRPSRPGARSARRPGAPSARPGPRLPRRGPIRPASPGPTCATASLDVAADFEPLDVQLALDLLAQLGGQRRRIGWRADAQRSASGWRTRDRAPARARRARGSTSRRASSTCALKLGVDRRARRPRIARCGGRSPARRRRPSAPGSGTSPPRRTAGTAPARASASSAPRRGWRRRPACRRRLPAFQKRRATAPHVPGREVVDEPLDDAGRAGRRRAGRGRRATVADHAVQRAR